MLNPRATRCAVCDAPVATLGRSPVGVQISLGGIAALPADELRLASELGKALAPSIHIRKRIGRGGMGIVFVGRDETLKRDVAIKVLSPDFADDPTIRARFTREAEAAAGVTHPNIVSIHHVGLLPDSQIPYFVMQFVDGPSVADTSGRMLPEPRVRRVIGEVASGLAAAHRRDVVHRDIKPGNIIIDGETGRALLLDFGIAAAVAEAKRSSRDRLTTEGMYVGTPEYMSPEMASGEDAIDKSDIYALGVVAWEMLTGKPPFEGKGLKVMAAHVNNPLPDLHSIRADISPELVALVERSLAKDPKDRPSAQTIVDHLLPSSRHSIEWPPPGLAPLRRASAYFRFGLMALVVTIVAFVVVLSSQSMPAPLENGGARALAILEAAHTSIVGSVDQTFATSSESLEREAMWYAAAYAALAFVLISVLYATVQSVRALRFARLARRSGYPWSTIADVMSDMRRDGGDLVNGLGVYAFLGDDERKTLLRMRRARLIGIVAATVLSVSAMVAWVSGLLGARVASGTSALKPVAGRWMVSAPATVIGVTILLALYEAVVRRRGAQMDEEWQGAHVVRPELVANWVVSAGRKLATSAAVYLLPIEALLGVVLSVAVLASLVVASAAMATSIRAASRRSDALAWVARDFSDTTRSMEWRRLDRALDRSSSAVAKSTPVTVASQTALLSTFIPRELGAHTLLPREQADTITLVRGSRALDTLSVTSALRALPRAPTESTLLDLADHVPRQALDAWRTVARGAALPLFWAYRENPDDLESPMTGAFSTGADRLRILASANLFEGITALSRRDYAAAETRARENLAVVRQLLRAGTMNFQLPEAVVRDAASMLESIGRAKGQPALISEAVELRDALTRQLIVHPSAGALFADPSYQAIVQTVGDTTLAPAVRVRLAEYTATGFCSNPHEVMFGVDSTRLALVHLAHSNLADLPGASKLLAPWERWLSDAVTTGVTRPVVSRTPTTGPIARPVAAATSLFRLTGLRSRLAYCGLS